MRILVVCAHPDDEVLGCGGTIARAVAEGHEVAVIFMSDGASSRGGEWVNSAKERLESASQAADILGYKLIGSGIPRFDDNAMDGVPLLQVVREVEEVVKRIEPVVIYTHAAGDLNIDHRITHQAVVTAARFFPDTAVKMIYGMEVVSSTEWGTGFWPNVFIDISDYFTKKIQAYDCYADETRARPHPRSNVNVSSLAINRGSTAGYDRAEAFEMVRARI